MIDTATWFDLTARENFERHLRDPQRCLQLGCFTGDATMWLLEHGCSVTDIDTFEGSDEHAGIDMAEVQEVYLERTAEAERLSTLVGTTDEWLVKLRCEYRAFDFIYIDADHHSAAVLSDAVLAWPLLESGGLMAFDDWTWGQELGRFERPHTGISAFMAAYGDHFDVVDANTQLWVRKR